MSFIRQAESSSHESGNEPGARNIIISKIHINSVLRDYTLPKEADFNQILTQYTKCNTDLKKKVKMKKKLVTVSGLLYRQIKHKNLTVNHRNKGSKHWLVNVIKYLHVDYITAR